MLHDSQTDVIYVPMAIRCQFPRLRKSLSETIVKAARIKFFPLRNDNWSWRHRLTNL